LTATAKYLFDLDFGEGTDAAGKPIPPSEFAARLAEAESKAYGEGYTAGENDGVAAAQRRSAAAFEQIGDALGRLAGRLAAIDARVETEAAELAVAVARKLAPELVLREPMTEIAALITECLRHLAAAPHVVVRVNEALHETASAKLEEIARGRGFDGRLVVIAEPDIAVGDCRIEWADGGLVRDQAKTDLEIGNLIERYLGARRVAATPEPGDIDQ
jgi:flagellar assembly protein FliH